MVKIKEKLYRLKRLIKEIKYLKNNFLNWDDIIKRAINGKVSRELSHRNGLVFRSNNMNTLSIFKEIFIKKVYTNNLVDIQENDVVFDIGANIGVFSLFASTIKGTQVYAFEPHPANFKQLEENVSINNLKQINSFNYAIGLKNEKRFMFEGTIPGGHKLSYDKSLEPSGGDIEVEMVSIESMMDSLQIDNIDFLKLDCEGAEGEIIKSLGAEGLKKIQKVAIEFHDNNSVLNHEEIIEYLKNANFQTNLKWDGKSYFGYIYGKRI